MGYYQARLSIETARLLEGMRIYYEKKIGGNVSKGDCLIMAYADSLWVEDWKKIFDEPTPPTDKYEISPTAQLLKVQVTDDVKNGIQDLKKTLPKLIGTRSVTVGISIREILKAAYIKNNKSKIPENIRDLFRQEKERINYEVNSLEKPDIINLLDGIENQIIDLLN